MKGLLLLSVFLISACSTSYDVYDGVDKAYCDKVKMDFSLAKSAKDVCIDHYVKTYTKQASSASDIAEGAVFECNKVISIAASSSYDAAVCAMAERNGMSVQKVNNMISSDDEAKIRTDISSVKKDAMNRVVKYQSSL
ncbi:hypothetical protein RZR66_12750 [Citrobacter freundii]|uniref:hypothetical protein n=1 Tax=Enterobacteriaceae TaxID=543 RepID=UPI0009A9C3C3|nr:MULTISPECIES: hypothetical protein [Enterobacteriaceae]EAV6124181.1 hypothetical protein [Salmonella enterica subsp. enterica serovar Anatum]EBH9986693.1 hypothetical protein [Salmonella enterica subsp. enterica serovar Amager]MBW6637091.1 hypothetical protein [Salmonella enterica subsp. enterica serovar Weltevreden]EAO9626496.1 hypothetical protein [Salmonella enterica]EAV5172887.1 hypothetical protein [Salmonella enterica]